MPYWEQQPQQPQQPTQPGNRSQIVPLIRKVKQLLSLPPDQLESGRRLWREVAKNPQIASQLGPAHKDKIMAAVLKDYVLPQVKDPNRAKEFVSRLQAAVSQFANQAPQPQQPPPPQPSSPPPPPQNVKQGSWLCDLFKNPPGALDKSWWDML